MLFLWIHVNIGIERNLENYTPKCQPVIVCGCQDGGLLLFLSLNQSDEKVPPTTTSNHYEGKQAERKLDRDNPVD